MENATAEVVHHLQSLCLKKPTACVLLLDIFVLNGYFIIDSIPFGDE